MSDVVCVVNLKLHLVLAPQVLEMSATLLQVIEWHKRAYHSRLVGRRREGGEGGRGRKRGEGYSLETHYYCTAHTVSQSTATLHYSGQLWDSSGYAQVSSLERCPHFKGNIKFYMCISIICVAGSVSSACPH